MGVKKLVLQVDDGSGFGLEIGVLWVVGLRAEAIEPPSPPWRSGPARERRLKIFSEFGFFT